ncbi:hypothetical protein [Sphingomonas sp. CLY1604]|uniref:hypothetical protein n=1 Tax=Sphingomonas sp. CLY1604 TaxID=3457786 RepID=UPI003FD806D8
MRWVEPERIFAVDGCYGQRPAMTTHHQPPHTISITAYLLVTSGFDGQSPPSVRGAAMIPAAERLGAN